MSVKLCETSHSLFQKAVDAAIRSAVENGGSGKILPLQGLVDLESGLVYLGALTPRDNDAFVFNEEPLLTHKKEGLFESGQYGARISSYQLRYSKGPTAHQQMLVYACQKAVVTADDAHNKRGIAINLQVVNNTIKIIIDGKSLSINQTAQYLRTVHEPGHSLSEHEARNDVLKASGQYSDLCEAWVSDKIQHACHHAAKTCRALSEPKPGFFSKHTDMPVEEEHLTDEAMAAFYKKSP